MLIEALSSFSQASEGEKEPTFSSRVNFFAALFSSWGLPILLNSIWFLLRKLLFFLLFFFVGLLKVVSLLLGDLSGPGQALEKWLALVRKRSGKYRPSGFPHRQPKIEAMPSGSLHFFTRHHQRYGELVMFV